MASNGYYIDRSLKVGVNLRKFSVITDVGRKRPNNRTAIMSATSGVLWRTGWRHNGGEVASRYAIEIIKNLMGITEH